MPSASPPDPSTPPLQQSRPIEFRSLSEEIAAGIIVMGLSSSVLALLFGGLVGALGAHLGKLCGGHSTLGGTALVVLAFWIVPLFLLLPVRPWQRFVPVLILGPILAGLLQWRIHTRDIGEFYPWILTALPLALVLGIIFEPLRLAHGGNTDVYDDHGVTIAGGVIFVGNRMQIFLLAAAILGITADIFSLGHRRLGALFAGLLSGGLIALPPFALLAWRGDSAVDSLFGSSWTIAWTGVALGALTGATTGLAAALIRERQQLRHQQILDSMAEQ